MARSSHYQPSDEAPATATHIPDVRPRIRLLKLFPFGSSEWFTQVESIQNLAVLAELEDKTQPNKSGTLWDREAVVVRTLIEECKLNLIVRMLYEFKQLLQHRNFIEDTEVLRDVIAPRFDSKLVENRIAQFEQSLGRLLHCCLESVEGLQLIDLPLVISHCKQVLDFGLKHKELLALPRVAALPQEVLVLHYLNSIVSRMEQLDETRILSLLEEHDLVSTTISYLYEYYAQLGNSALLAACTFLAGVMAAEEFPRLHDKFLTTKDAIDKLVLFEGLFLRDLLTLFPEHKKRLSRLVDYIQRKKPLDL